jgi:hypothetical protein
MKHQRIVFLLVLFLASCSGSPTESLLTPTNLPLPTTTFTPEPTAVISPTAKPTKTPIPLNYVVLQDPFPNCSVMISQNDAFNGLFPSRDEIEKCQGERNGHFDLSPYQCTGEKTVVAPAEGKAHIYDPGDGKHAMEITLPPNTLIEGIDNAFQFIGLAFDPKKVDSINVGVAHIDFLPSIGEYVTARQELGTLTYVPESIIGAGILGYSVFVIYNGKEYHFSPDLFVHSSWATNPASPYDMTPTVDDYKSGCSLLNK